MPRHLLRSRLLLTVFCSPFALAAALPHPADAATTGTKKTIAPRHDARHKARAAAVEGGSEQLVITARRTRSEQGLSHVQIQRILPGVNPVKALEMLPGVVFNNADPWGNNEQNSSLYVHGFNQNQLGYTLDGIPLGDQAYGNYNGLSPQRAAISENIGSASVSSGAGALGTASTSNLGGTLQFTTQDPLKKRGAQIEQVFGSWSTFRTFARLDTGEFGHGNSAYVSFSRQDARAWDFAGHQGGYQVNAKFVHNSEHDHFSTFFDWSQKVEPNEDSITLPQGYGIYVRPFTYPDFNYAKANANAVGLNYRNYYSAAQREDFLAYSKWTHDFSENLHWDNSIYYHHDLGEGVVAGPISAAGLPTLFAAYFPGQDLNTVFGGSGYATRTTEYWDNRGGLMSTLRYHLGKHSIELGGWYERNNNTQARRWYPLDANNPTTPYERQQNALIDQYTNNFYTNTFVTNLQDNWQISKNFSLMAGFKSELVYTNGTLPVAAKPGSLSPSYAVTAPGGEIDAARPFLPAFGAVWDITKHEQWFANIQENMRSFQDAGYGNATPWGATSQAAFEEFKKNGKPETSWTYETGLREHRQIHLGPLTAIEGQVEYYHVHFSNRLLAVATTQTLSSIIGSATTLANVGSVTTDGMDFSFTTHFGPHFSLYNALSYNKSTYNDNYSTGSSVIHTAGKNVVGMPDWSEKFVFTTNWGNAYGQFTGDVIGKRYATYTNDMWAAPYAQFNLNAGYTFRNIPHLASLKVQGNITNLTNTKGWSTINATQTSGQFSAYPIAPRMFFLSLSAAL
ncbi:TonB-dependent receptor [Gluconobacter sp.]|uniref:TonB-dependent receptor n=1 Tax=Gluconobacter sp. TaxID=1876758 RepID=UPI0039E7BC70